MDSNCQQAAPVSAEVPLISNQDVCMNIALIKQYHENLPWTDAKNIVLNALRRLNLTHIANKRNPSLSSEERFCVMLLRAVLVRDSIVMIDRPFKIIPHLKDSDYIFRTLKKIDDFYLTCHIYDYIWLKEKYGEL
jgi:ABC-type lipoprotein export system ATPase subunit